MLKAPLFWKEKSIISFLLLPLSLFYYLGYLIYRVLKKEVEVGKPVLCIGNLVMGGAGKTPLVIKLDNYCLMIFQKFLFFPEGI